ncbi:hypothetical protein [Rhodoferax fermentans]|uniref:Uncharacterized protein n=1 Tax=Rhodoferax fermentans TaxID=28066 RepID=A0A1T1ATY9_RHOFE|nr:hypothetical protein [Rhodoferax fermentans]MBK1683053.1 hypothetical protein [Rhodoferax fermentans]OOV07483.1 hypothetical protein RF819_12770 [Rhodoferax fermentans]
MSPTQPKLPKAKNAATKRPLSLAVADMFRPSEPHCEPAPDVLTTTTPGPDAPDFPEGREDPAQSAELERQQDA